MLKPTVFEYPLNERIRLFLRLERLFQRIAHHARQDSVWDTQACIRLLLELNELTHRGDLKTDIMKELERHHAALKPLLSDSDIDHDRLQALLERQQCLLSSVYDSDGKLTDSIRQDELLSGVQQRTCVPGGGCDFDLPLYHQWLNQPHEQRLQQINHWTAPCRDASEAISLSLEVLRLSANTQQVEAEQGYYEQVLDTNHPLQLLRIILSPGLNCYPEVSAGKHRFSIRFFTMPNTRERPTQHKGDVDFSLSTCGL